MLSVFLLISMATLWLFAHRSAKHSFGALKAQLPITYNSAIVVPPDDTQPPQLIALCIDLLRKTHCTAPYETLSAHEQRMVLHAHAIDAVPAWMSRYASLGLSSANRAVLAQLRQVKSSRPERPKEHYGAVKALLRSREKN